MHYIAKVKHDTVKIKEEKHNSHDVTSVRLVSFSVITFCIQMFSTINPPPLIKEKLVCTTVSLSHPLCTNPCSIPHCQLLTNHLV